MESMNWRILVLLTLFLVLPMTSRGQVPQDGATTKHPVLVRKAAPREPTTLPVTSSKITEVPSFTFYGPIQCDGEGNMFFRSASSKDLDAVFKLAQPDETRSKLFRLPSDSSEANALLAFAVGPLGAPYVLTQEQENVFRVFTFDSDGDVKSDAKLDTPDHVVPLSLAVLGNETLLATGYYLRDAPEALRGKGYAALFDSSGRLLRDLSRRFSLERADPEPSAAYKSFAIRSAPDGNLYLLKADTVLVISQTGEIVRRLRFTVPDPKDAAIDLIVANGLASIQLGPRGPAEGVRFKYLVLDTMTAKEYGYFAQPEEDAGMLACFTRETGFTFLHHEKSHLRLLTAALR